MLLLLCSRFVFPDEYVQTPAQPAGNKATTEGITFIIFGAALIGVSFLRRLPANHKPWEVKFGLGA